MAGIHSRILAVMDSVEEDLDCRIRLDDVSRRSGLSKYHLHRVFKSLTGRNLGEYIRARKLAASLGLLLGGELRVADIAAQLGFADYSAYTHAFKREFGISPTDYRRQPRELPVTNRLGRYDLYGSAQSDLLRPTILAKPAFTVVGKPFRMEVGENLVTRRSTRVAVQFFQEFAPSTPRATRKAAAGSPPMSPRSRCRERTSYRRGWRPTPSPPRPTPSSATWAFTGPRTSTPRASSTSSGTSSRNGFPARGSAGSG